MCRVQNKKSQGFTLVELAIVMIIIGLLIGGVLKGQELVENSKVTGTISQMKDIRTAMVTFIDTYRALPGDIATATAVLPNCNAAPCSNGNGNGTLDAPAVGSPQLVNSEPLYFWHHLSAANMFTSVGNQNNVAFGEGLPIAKIGGGYSVGFIQGAPYVPGGVAPAYTTGIYLTIRATPTSNIITQGVLTGQEAWRIDSKMDDGMPNTGDILTTGSSTANGCHTGTSSVDTYRGNASLKACSLNLFLQ